jgi:hypothetical protein
MLTIAITLFFPIATAAFLLHIRRKYQLGIYLAWSLPFVILALSVWLSTSDVVYYYCGRLCSSGFESWGAPLAVATLVAVCAMRLRRPWQRWLQGWTAFFAFNFCLLFAGWIAWHLDGADAWKTKCQVQTSACVPLSSTVSRSESASFAAQFFRGSMLSVGGPHCLRVVKSGGLLDWVNTRSSEAVLTSESLPRRILSQHCALIAFLMQAQQQRG